MHQIEVKVQSCKIVNIVITFLETTVLMEYVVSKSQSLFVPKRKECVLWNVSLHACTTVDPYKLRGVSYRLISSMQSAHNVHMQVHSVSAKWPC